MHPWIETVSLTPATTPITVLAPDPATTVVWRMTPAGESNVLVAGPRTKATYHATKELPVCLRLRIRPGGVIPLLGTAPDGLVDQVVPLQDLCGRSATDLADRLVTYRDELERAAEVLRDYLVGRLPERLPSALHLVRSAIVELAGPSAVPSTAPVATRTTPAARPARADERELVEGAGVAGAAPWGGTARVDVAAARLGVSERYLRRVFRQAVGVSPKHFARITRVRSLLGQRARWAEAAAYAGYSDQSHLIADFRALMHVTPKAFAAGDVPLSTC